MRPFLISLLFLSVTGLAMMPGGLPGSAGLSEGMPAYDTPEKLIEAWLRFHETDLCQGVDTVFVFDRRGMDLWCLVEDEKSYQKLQELIEPLHDCCKIELYTTRPPAEKRSAGDMDPPASLWENYLLRSYLGDPFARAKERRGFDTLPELDVPPPDETLKQRLLIYADQTLEWNRKMKRYAMDLPSLAGVALDPAYAPELRLRANAVCMAHAQNLNKYLEKLAKNLVQAFPKPSKEEHLKPEKPDSSGKALLESAGQISRAAQNVARRVYRFIHPEHYTVGLEELRQPSLLQALAALERMDTDFQKALAKSALK
jgi:hypothetical protein